MGAAGRALLLVAAISLSAATLPAQQQPVFDVSPGQTPVGGTVRIALVLENELRDYEVPEPPTTNLRIVQGPRSGYEMHWSPAGLVRRRVYEWTAVATTEGTGTVGPSWIGSGSRRITVPRTDIRIAGEERHRGVTLDVDVSSPSVDVGEQISVTWTLNSSERLRDVRIIENASFEGFWVEEIPITGERESIQWKDGVRHHTLLLRSAVLYPLQSGALPIRPMRTESEILIARDFQSPFSIFEGRFETVPSAARPVLVRVAERDARAQVTGRTTLECSAPVVGASGNVTWDVVARSVGNLRLSSPPTFAREIEARTEVEEGGEVAVDRTVGGVRMTRRWKMLIFPERAGRLQVPDLLYRYWDPAASVLRESRCTGASLAIPDRPGVAPSTGHPAADTTPARGALVAVVSGIAVLAGGLMLLVVRRRRRDPVVGDVLASIRAHDEPRDQRAELERWLRDRDRDPFALAWEESEEGERWRAVLSLLERHERAALTERDTSELERRIARFVELVLSRG